MFTSLFFYCVAFMAGILLVIRVSPLYVSTFLILILCFWGHAIGTYFYSRMHTDSVDQYFALATPDFQGFGTAFVENMTWYVRYLFTGDSVLATFYIFTSFTFLGSVLWYTLYLRLASKLNISKPSLIWPALILMCWPSFLFFTSGIGKDSLSFFFIPLILLCYLNLQEKRMQVWNLFLITFSLFALFCLRPYLMMVFGLAYSLYTLKGVRRLSVGAIIAWILIFILTLYAASWSLQAQGHFDDISLTSITERSAMQQNAQAIGTFFKMPSDNPIERLFLLPYSFIMNLCFPLIYLARNIQGYLASVENFVLIAILWKIFKQRQMVKQFFMQTSLLRFMFILFIVGMFFIAAVNTNLGLSMRQKSMYLPVILIIYCLLYVKKKRDRN